MLSIISQLIFSIDFLTASVRLAMPLATASIGEIISERGGVVNIGLEGMMLAGALGSFVGAYYLNDPWLGLLCGILAGGLVALLHAFVVVTLASDQVVSGVALNIGVLGLTTFIYRAVFGITERPIIPHFEPWPVPLLSEIPVIGPVLFNQIPLVYLTYGLVVLAGFVLFRTEWGLGLRASGEHPRAAESVGLSVQRLRYESVIACGMLAGLAGSFFTLGQLFTFIEGMTGGRGFIVLAIVIVANWLPARAALVAVVFGGAEAVGLRIQALNVGIPYQLALVFPYLLTLLIYAGLVGRTRMPRALGLPYVRD
ncbi:MAG TPA: ABC transporter permease [Anaerolineae bacterium]|nr:ABC transporter permease [Anaerolineae bacterium]